MADAYTGEIRIFGGNYAPMNWAFCEGQQLSIAEHSTLFSIIGTTYGGDGRIYFNLPNLQGRTPIGQGRGPGLTERLIGVQGGEETVTLTQAMMPSHTHTAAGVAANGNLNSPDEAVWAQYNSGGRTPTLANVYAATATNVMNATELAAAGQSLPHANMQPYLTMRFIICLQGEYPARD